MSKLMVSFEVWAVENGFKVVMFKVRKGFMGILRPTETEYVASSTAELDLLFHQILNGIPNLNFEKVERHE